jgi:hypothetical protein
MPFEMVTGPTCNYSLSKICRCSVVTLVPVPAAVAVSANPSAPPQTTSTTTTTTTVTTGASTVTTTPVATAVAAADAPADTPDDGAMGGKSVTITVAKVKLCVVMK